MKIAHLVVNLASGMLNSTIEEVEAEIRAGVDARLVIPGGSDPETTAPIGDMDFAMEADLRVIHSSCGINAELTSKPFFFVAHGSPNYCFNVERYLTHPSYSTSWHLANLSNCEGLITHWPSHTPFWENIAPPGKVYTIAPSVDLDKWTPGPAVPGIFRERDADINIISTGRWLESDSPFEAVNAVFHFAKLYPEKDIKLHIFGLGGRPAGFVPLLTQLEDRGLLGINMGMTDRLVDVYRSADFCITNHKTATRTVRECLACGCQLVGDEMLLFTPYRATRDSIPAYVDAMRRAYQGRLDKPVERRNLNRVTAEGNFNPDLKALRYIRLYENALSGAEVSAC